MNVSARWQKPWIDHGLRFLLGGVFLYAGWLKILEPAAFADSVAGFRLLPAAFVNPMALSLPVFEAALGVLLIVGWQTRAAALGVLILTGVFIVALASAMARGLAVDCGCFGGQGLPVTQNWFALGRDVLLGVAALVCYLRQRRRTAASQGTSRQEANAATVPVVG